MCLRRLHLKEIRQIKLVSSNKDLACVSEKPASKLSCDSKFFICPTNAHNSYKIVYINMFRFTQTIIRELSSLMMVRVNRNMLEQLL